MGTCGVYRIRHKITGKAYVGQSSNIEKRWRHHRARLLSGKHANSHLQSAFNKYGADQFVWEIALTCAPEALTAEEQREVDAARAAAGVYNQAGPVDAPSRGTRQTPETIKVRAEALRGRKRPFSSPEDREKAARRNIAKFAGKPLTKEHRDKIAAALRGKPKTRAHAEKAAQNRKYRKHSPETRRKMSETKAQRKREREAAALQLPEPPAPQDPATLLSDANLQPEEPSTRGHPQSHGSPSPGGQAGHVGEGRDRESM